MSFTNNELFTQLSEEQEEIVSGGAFGLSLTLFEEENTALQTASLSGPNGSVAGGVGVKQEIDTAGLNFIDI